LKSPIIRIDASGEMALTESIASRKTYAAAILRGERSESSLSFEGQ